MNTIQINIDDYLGEDEKKALAASAFREAVAEQASENLDRLISNAVYNFVFIEIDKIMGGEFKEILYGKVHKVVNSVSAFDVFKKPDAWDRQASKGWEYLQEVMAESKPLIKKKVESIIEDYDSSELREEIKDSLYDVISQKIFSEG